MSAGSARYARSTSGYAHWPSSRTCRLRCFYRPLLYSRLASCRCHGKGRGIEKMSCFLVKKNIPRLVRTSGPGGRFFPVACPFAPRVLPGGVVSWSGSSHIGPPYGACRGPIRRQWWREQMAFGCRLFPDFYKPLISSLLTKPLYFRIFAPKCFFVKNNACFSMATVSIFVGWCP